MLFAWAETSSTLPLIDLVSLNRNRFQGPIPDVSYQFGKLTKGKVAVTPHDAKHWNEEYLKYVFEISKHNTVLYFNRGDYPLKIKNSNMYPIQVAKRLSDESRVILWPYNVENLSYLEERYFSKQPIISFVGYNPRLTPKRILQSFPDFLEHPIRSQGSIVRRLGVRAIKRSGLPNMVICRRSYSGIPRLVPDYKKVREEYISSLSSSDLVFCPRGDANTSQRFYEVIGCGRIPIVPDSKISYPFMGEYKNLLTQIRIAPSSRDLANQIKAAWDLLNPHSYSSIQRELRQLFRECLNYSSYVKTFFGVKSIEEIIPYFK